MVRSKKKDDSDDSDSDDDDGKNRPKGFDLTDEQLFEACGGLTAHK